jgi:hypothetical protein
VSRRQTYLRIAAVWAVAATATGVIAAFTALGPPVVHLTHDHGVHVGDIAAAVALALIATATHVSLLREADRAEGS